MSVEVTVKEAETYTWWSDFLAARTYAVECQLRLGKTPEEICYTLNFNDVDHVLRVIEINKLES